MANVAHADMTGSNVHEPKGIDAASSGQVYVASGTGSGAWTTVAGLSFTGMVAPFLTPIAPTGWYELNGTTISSTSDSALYNAMTIQSNGNRISGAATISGLASTSNFKVGYYVFGTGITAGTTILSIDSSTDITMSANATSSGTSTVIVSPWQLDTGTITLPDMTTAGRYLRSRTSSYRMGLTQSSQNLSHTHGFTTDNGGGQTVTSGTESATHTHGLTGLAAAGVITSPVNAVGTNPQYGNSGTITTGTESATHTHSVTVAAHVHTGTTNSDGASETRPESLVVMWCVKR